MATKKLNALALLAEQHRHMQKLCDSLLRRKPKRLERLLELSQLLSLNITLKQRVLYPSLAAFDLDWPFANVREEQLQIRRTLCHLLCLDVDKPMFRVGIRALRALSEQQFLEEEQTLFPQVRACLGGKRLGQMATAMKRLSRQLAAAKQDRFTKPERTPFGGELDDARRMREQQGAHGSPLAWPGGNVRSESSIPCG